MKTIRLPRTALTLLAVVSLVQLTTAQSGAISGLYRISGGTFSECCGFIGIPNDYSLPDEGQAYVRFTINLSSGLASLAILGEDTRTVFSVNPCPSPGPVQFSFSNGVFMNGQYVFDALDGGGVVPVPLASSSYVVKPIGTSLSINGTLRLTRPLCADVPTRFAHTNVTATLLPGPRLTFLDRTKAGTRIMVQGQAGWTDVTEASSDLVNWTAISTNFMDYSLCPICPFAIVEDAASTNLMSRFYRAVEYRN